MASSTSRTFLRPSGSSFASNRTALFSVAKKREPTHWVEIDRQAILNNIKTFRELLKPKILLGCMLKGNCYGVGFFELLAICHDNMDVMHAFDLNEALLVREYEKINSLARKRLIAHDTTCAEVEPCAELDIEVFLPGDILTGGMERLNRLTPGKPLKAHIFIDTGLSREGFLPYQLPGLLVKIAGLEQQKKIKIIGVTTHFSSGDKKEITKQQIKIFEAGYQLITETLKPAVHLEKCLSNSAATLSFYAEPLVDEDHVRIGQALNYGLFPSVATEQNATQNNREVKLHPVVSWRCSTSNVRKFPAGTEMICEDEALENGLSIKLREETMVAQFQVGAGDGYLSTINMDLEKAYVLVKGRRCKILSVELNTLCVNVGAVAEPEETIIATLIGKDGTESLSPATVASWELASTPKLAVHIFTAINSTIPRIIVDGPDALTLVEPIRLRPM